MRGTAFVFGDEINTDIIAPSDYFGQDIEVMAQHVFEPERPNFVDEIEDGDFVVAGKHFGSGSSRESAPWAIQTAGIGAVIAESFSRIFYRNSIAIGLPALTCPGITDGVSEGDELEIDFEEGLVHNLTTDESFEFESFPPEIQSIFEEGGLIQHYKNNPDGLTIN